MSTLLGQGTYGAVRYCRKDEIVVKKFKQAGCVANKSGCVTGSRISSPVISTSMLREIGLLKYLTGHPNIIKILSVGQGEINLEHGGQSLRQLMSRSGKPDVDPIVGQLALAINYMHMSGVAHRDIKPENILICGVQLTVCDFGISVATVGRKVAPKLGTYRYRAPELFIDLPVENAFAVDIWAFGCVVYELLTGQYVVGEQLLAILVQDVLLGAERFDVLADKLTCDKLGEYSEMLVGCLAPAVSRLRSDELVDKVSVGAKRYWYVRPASVYCGGRRRAVIIAMGQACRSVVHASTRNRVFCLAANLYDQMVYGVQCDDFVQTGLVDSDTAEQIAVYLAKKYYVDDELGVIGPALIKRAWVVLNFVHLEQLLLCDLVDVGYDKYVEWLTCVNLSCCDAAAVARLCEK